MQECHGYITLPSNLLRNLPILNRVYRLVYKGTAMHAVVCTCEYHQWKYLLIVSSRSERGVNEVI